MKRFLIPIITIMLVSCMQKQTAKDSANENIIDDPHSLAEPSKVLVKHLDLNINVDFTKQQIAGKATWKIDNLASANQVIFDTKDLTISKVTTGEDEQPATFSLGKYDSLLGAPLLVNIQPNTKVVTIYYSTAPTAGALQWLAPQQTAGKQHPFLFTQSQPILARSWVPCQDGPAVRFTYNATVKVPADLMAVMSAENPQQKSAEGVYHFKQQHPIPSYLMALAVGDLQFKPIDNRTGVYAEPSVVDKAAWEFADMGKMVSAAEKMYGPYAWGRYDVLVLPPSFPYGGMENPNLTFATPTVIAGDRSLVSLIAHELAHSWSGNLVTNATWDDMWLNEGFTTYFERRIVEALYGKEEATMQAVLGRQSVDAEIAEGDSSFDSRLKTNSKGQDPDVVSSDVPYEKGYAFLRLIEETIGRSAFDAFLQQHFKQHAFTSITTEQFLAELNKRFGNDPQFKSNVDVQQWVYGKGIPDGALVIKSPVFSKIDSLLKVYENNRSVQGLNKLISSTNSKVYFITHLPAGITAKDMEALDAECKFTTSGNAEVQTPWYILAIQHQYAPAYPYIESFLTTVGRRKFVLPMYKELLKTEAGKAWATKIYNKARGNYHPVTYTSVDALFRK